MDDLISRQAAIEASCTCYGGAHCNHYPCNDVQAIIDLPSAQQWIPCSESLPEESGEYLVTCLHHSGELWIEVDRFDKDGGNGPYQWWRFDERVIAWMPLPEPYKAESEDKG